MTSTTVKPAQRMRRGVIMEHHLGFWPIPLLRGRNRRSRRGCRWNLNRHYSSGQDGKSQYFRELLDWSAEGLTGNRSTLMVKEGRWAEIVRLQRTWIHLMEVEGP